ncbi:hypothetical protein FS749_016092 [Ceratobasidium sp. UAMH 11750]|nr:hypothetical protein FS749_016092 [Ceratobasidium sp. UAMH 11750]
MDERTGPARVSSLPTLPSNRAISHKWIVLAGIVESGALAPVYMLAALILYVVQDGQETLLVPLLAPIAALVPTLQIIQIQLGLDSSSRASFYPAPIAALVNGPIMVGRSPYLVPAPRYRDRFSSSEAKPTTSPMCLIGIREAENVLRSGDHGAQDGPGEDRVWDLQVVRTSVAFRGRAGLRRLRPICRIWLVGF